MKNKKRLIPIIIISFILVLIITFVIVVVINDSINISTGRYLEASNGTPMFVHNGEPDCMSTDNEDMFDNLDTGDKIIVVHDLWLLTYPGKTHVYAVFKLKDGTIDDISKSTIDKLVEMGWLEEKAE
ncbi:MAG: hypothetical protein IKI94_01820 [Ruminococcus sp.]|jgi:hypothetical protein|nr:hypothetical protein [Ruminococcus sp.]